MKRGSAKRVKLEFTLKQLHDLQFALVHCEEGWRRERLSLSGFVAKKWMEPLIRKVSKALVREGVEEMLGGRK